MSNVEHGVICGADTVKPINIKHGRLDAGRLMVWWMSDVIMEKW